MNKEQLNELKENNPISYYSLVLDEFKSNLQKKLDNNKITNEQAIVEYNNALNTFKSKLLELEDITEEQINQVTNNFNMTQNTLSEFAQATLDTYQIPSVLINLIEQEYETEADGVEALMQVLNEDEDAVLGIFTGEQLLTPEGVDLIAQAFDTTQTDEGYLGLQYIAMQDRNTFAEENDYELETEDELLEALGLEYVNEEQEDEEESEDDESEDDEEQDEDEFSAKQELAEFKKNHVVSLGINKYIKRAEKLVQDEIMLPSEFNAQFGTLYDLDDDERLQEFSKFCQANEIDELTGFKMLEFNLDSIESRGKLPMFTKIANDEIKEMTKVSNFSKHNDEKVINANVEQIMKHLNIK